MLRKKVLFEDTVQQYNRWVSGIASHELHAEPVSLKDLLGKEGNPDDTQSMPNSKSVKTLPFPLSNVLGEIKDLFYRVKGVQSSLGDAYNFPLVTKNEKTKQILKNVMAGLDAINRELQKIDKEMDTKIEKE